MDARTTSKTKLPSRHVTEGPERAPHRSYEVFDLSDVAEVFKRTPYVADLKPGGRYVAKDLFEAGGVPLLIKTLITDGRFSGATRGFCVRHVGPEAAVGGPVALLRDGDVIELDADNGTLGVRLSDEELAARKAQWKPRDGDFASGYLWKHARQVGPALAGAVTHPGGAAENECYADI